jgi:hypothetical protein
MRQIRSLVVGVLAVVGACADKPDSALSNPAEVPADFLQGVTAPPLPPVPHDAPAELSHANTGVPNIDSIANFTGQFTTPGFDSSGAAQTIWPYTMVGKPPEHGHTTVINAPIIPVTVELLDADGNVATTTSGAPLRMATGPDIVHKTVHSPIFEPFHYTSGFAQFTDGLMRAQFWNRMGGGDDWHTVLLPSVKTARTIQVPLGMYRFAPNPDGTCCKFVMVEFNTLLGLVFPPSPTDTTTVLGAAEQAHEMTTRDITTLLFNNVLLYQGDPATGGQPGFHAYDLEAGDAANGNKDRRYVMTVASWLSPGLATRGFGDVAAYSAQMAEVFADPFADNVTPWWRSTDPFVATQTFCQNTLENADVTKILSANPVHAIPMHGRTYHVQNVALLPWFAFESPSSAHLGAYTFPDETTVESLSASSLAPGCPAPS